MSREKTVDEIREEFLSYVGHSIKYWEREGKNTKDALEGLAFSIMSALDGSSELPAFIVAPDPHHEDKQFHIDEDGDYYPENYKSNIKGDIAGCLHELIGQYYSK